MKKLLICLVVILTVSAIFCGCRKKTEPTPEIPESPYVSENIMPEPKDSMEPTDEIPETDVPMASAAQKAR